MTGNAYVRSDVSGNIIRGFWSDQRDPSIPTGAEFEFSLSSVKPDRSFYGWDGYHCSDSTMYQSGENEWESVRKLNNLESTNKSGKTYLIDPIKHSILDLIEFLNHEVRVFCDARKSSSSVLNLYHTLPFYGWLQASDQVPPAYEPRRQPQAWSGSDPIFCLVHGFTGDPINWIELENMLREHSQAGLIPLLPGHGLDLDEFADFGRTEWEKGIETLFEWLKETNRPVIGVGLSMGGALALSHWQLLDAVVTINTPVNTPDWRRWFIPILSYVRNNHDPSGIEKSYPLKSIMEMGRLLRDTRDFLHRVKIPVLVLNHGGDKTVSEGHGRYMANQLPNATQRCIEKGEHVSPEDPEAARQILAEVFTWMDEIFDGNESIP